MDINKKKIEIYEEIKKNLLDSLPYEIDEEHRKEERGIRSIAAFQATNYSGTNKELADITGISKSSIQRYLTDKKLVESLTDAETYTIIKDSLLKNKQEGKIKGGINSTKNSVAIKDEAGKFICRIPYEGPIDKEQQKKFDVVYLAGMYLFKDISIGQLASQTGLSRDYIYDCLTSNLINTLLGENIETLLKKKLNSNYPTSMIRKIKER